MYSILLHIDPSTKLLLSTSCSRRPPKTLMLFVDLHQDSSWNFKYLCNVSDPGTTS